jgi:hypothetical protein
MIEISLQGRYWQSCCKSGLDSTFRNLEHLQPFEAPGPKSGHIFVLIGCKTGAGGNIFPVGTPAFAYLRG